MGGRMKKSSLNMFFLPRTRYGREEGGGKISAWWYPKYILRWQTLHVKRGFSVGGGHSHLYSFILADFSCFLCHVEQIVDLERIRSLKRIVRDELSTLHTLLLPNDDMRLGGLFPLPISRFPRTRRRRRKIIRTFSSDLYPAMVHLLLLLAPRLESDKP